MPATAPLDYSTVNRMPSQRRPSDAPPVPSAPARAWTDRELIDALRRGDRSAAGPLYRALRPVIDHALRRVLHGRHREFDDLMQSTFERLLTALAEGRFQEKSSLRTYAAAIAAHVALDAIRANARSDRRSAPSVDVAETSVGRPEARVEAIVELRRVQAILAKMSVDMAETLVLHDVLGHPLEEIAKMRGASVSATQSRLFRGRLEFQKRANFKIVRTL